MCFNSPHMCLTCAFALDFLRSMCFVEGHRDAQGPPRVQQGLPPVNILIASIDSEFDRLGPELKWRSIISPALQNSLTDALQPYLFSFTSDSAEHPPSKRTGSPTLQLALSG